MSDSVTESDTGKPVIDANGDRIGTLEDVRDGVPLVNPRPEIDPTATMALGWMDDPDVAPLRSQVIDTITDSSIRLRSNL